MWNPDEVVRLARALLDPMRVARVEEAAALPTWDERRSALQVVASDIWDALVSVAKQLPDDPSVTCDMVRRDRQLMERTMAEAAAKTTKAPKPKPEPKPKTHGGFRPEQKISLLKNKDGKVYGGENNPKRPGSSAHKLFSLYKNNMTVKEFIEAGGTGAALKYDAGHNYITVK